jgi:hypothetical protein
VHTATTPLYGSGTFWAAVGALAAVIAIPAAVLLRRFPPPHVIIYWLPVATSLLSTHAPGMEHADIKVTSHGHPVTHPYAVSMRIESRSRFDIRRNDFDGAQPMVFDLDAKIISPLVIDGSNELKDAVLLEGSQIKIQPTTIRRKQYLNVNVLTDGAPKLTTKNEPIQVRLREQYIHYLSWAALLAAVTVVPSFLGSTLLGSRGGRLSEIVTSVLTLLFIIGIFMLILTLVLLRDARKQARAGRRFETTTSSTRRRRRPSHE